MHVFDQPCIALFVASRAIFREEDERLPCPFCRAPIVYTDLTTIEALVDWSSRRGVVRAREAEEDEAPARADVDEAPV
jgi:hypothetical protein